MIHRPMQKYRGSCHCGAVQFEIETGINPFHRKRVAPDNFGINVYCLHDFDPAGLPVRHAVGAAMT